MSGFLPTLSTVTAADVATAVRIEMDTNSIGLAMIADVPTLAEIEASTVLAKASAVAAIPTTPLLAANYTAPDNTSISAIKAKTDTIPASPAIAGEYTTAIAAIPTNPLLDINYVVPDDTTLISSIWSHISALDLKQRIELLEKNTTQ